MNSVTNFQKNDQKSSSPEKILTLILDQRLKFPNLHSVCKLVILREIKIIFDKFHTPKYIYMIYVHTYIFMFGKVNPDNKD